MASTITNLINTIDIAFPVAGQDNDSQGFRNNFSIIRESLVATEGQIEGLQNSISTLGGSIYSTATHLVAKRDVSIGDSNSLSNTATVTMTVNSVGNLVLTSSDTSGVVVTLSESISTIGAYALTDSVTNSTTGTFAVNDVKNILVGATVTIASAARTVTKVDPVKNYITVTPEFPAVSAFAVGATLTFNNPYIMPTGDLYLDGNIFVTGNITAYAGSPSDSRLKENVTTITNALTKLDSIRGVYYDWTDAYLESIGNTVLMPKHDVGVIAQEVQETFPEVVFMKPNGDLGVKYEKLTSLLIQAVKELNEQVKTLTARVESLTTPNGS